jgi:hypothetical protein
MQKHKKYIKRVNLNPPKPNKSTATNSIDSEVDEISDKNSKNDYKNGQ